MLGIIHFINSIELTTVNLRFLRMHFCQKTYFEKFTLKRFPFKLRSHDYAATFLIASLEIIQIL